MRDPYSILGVRRDADAEEIKAAWRAKAKSVHPDQNQDDPYASQRFAEVGRAYEVLKDPNKRSRYDHQRLMAEARQREQTIMQQREAAREAAERAKIAKANAERILGELAKAEAEKAKVDQATKAAMQGAGAQPNSTQSSGTQQASSAKTKAAGPKAATESPEDVVSRIFGATPEAQAAAENLRQNSEAMPDAEDGETATGENSGRPLGPFELITSLVRRLRGAQPPEKAPDLFIDATVAIDDLINQLSITATLPDGREIRVPLEGGVTDGDTVRVKGQGLKVAGMQRGDAVVTLRVIKNEKFSVEGFDIRTVLPVTLENAVLGCETSVESPDGMIDITVPAWSGSDQVLTIENLGLPDGQGGRGNLLVEVRVLLWEKPDEKVTDLMRLMREGLFL
jgi:DnaJ-class molecular chaperone with C-terminal Zn finger domain